MKRIIAAAALAAAAAVPATAGAIPPNNSGVPLGTPNGCFVIATPAVPGECKFVGASGGVGYTGTSTGGYELSHQKKVIVCTDNKVSGYTLVKAVDNGDTWSSPGPDGYFAEGPTESFATGRVFTLKIIGVGFGAAGGQGTPSPAMASEPTVGPAPGFAGAEDGTSGRAVGSDC